MHAYIHTYIRTYIHTHSTWYEKWNLSECPQDPESGQLEPSTGYTITKKRNKLFLLRPSMCQYGTLSNYPSIHNPHLISTSSSHVKDMKTVHLHTYIHIKLTSAMKTHHSYTTHHRYPHTHQPSHLYIMKSTYPSYITPYTLANPFISSVRTCECY